MLLIEAQGLQAAEVCHKPPHQIVKKSGAVDHLDEKAVLNVFEMSTAMAMILLVGFR